MKRVLCLFVGLSFLFCTAYAQEGEDVYTLALEDGTVLTHIASAVETGDEYIDSENRLYKVNAVDEEKRIAFVEESGSEPMLSLTTQRLIPLAAQKRIGIYVTHSDESYEKGDGSSSVDDGWAGVHDVASALGDALTELGVDVRFDPATHLPHDAGAYRRSRATAAELLKSGPTALLDIHRDGIPDASEYTVKVGGQQMTKVRLLVGRSNPNSSANREFAKKLKAAADSQYPGLIKDIFIGKGNYNQELLPRSILLEFGTHTSDKQQVLRSVKPMAQVLHTVLFGATATVDKGEQQQGETPSDNASGDEDGVTGTPQSAEGSGRDGSWSGIGWIVGLALLGVIGFSILSAGRVQGLGVRLRHFTSELTGGMLGNDQRQDDKEKRE